MRHASLAIGRALALIQTPVIIEKLDRVVPILQVGARFVIEIGGDETEKRLIRTAVAAIALLRAVTFDEILTKPVEDFGNKNLGNNYGWMFTAYGIAGILGPQLAGWFKDSAAGSGAPIVWMTPFIIAGVACIVGAIIMKFTNPPKFSEEELIPEEKLDLKSA